MREKLISNAKDDELNYIVRKSVVPIAFDNACMFSVRATFDLCI